MIGRRSIITIFLVNALGVAAPSSATAPAKDDWILPKNACLRVEASAGAKSAPQLADQVDISWPAKVLSVNGQWLAISDDGGYTLRGRPHAKRWVLKDEVVRIIDNDTPSSYSSQIEAAPSANKRQLARLYWLRGICRQTKTPERFPEPQMAIADFREANGLDHTLADAWMRRAQLLAEIDPLKGQASWESFFKTAFGQFFYANSRKGTKPVSAHAGGTAPKSCGPSVSDCTADTLPQPADAVATLIPWSKYAPPQLFFEVGRAYQHLSDAYWPTAEAKDVANAKKAADDAAHRAENAKRAADDLAGEVKQLRTKASRIRKEAEQIARSAQEDVATLAMKAVARAATIAAEAEADAAKAKAVAADAKAKAATADADSVKAEAAADKAKGKYKEYFVQARRYFQWASRSNPAWYRPPAAEGDLFRARVAHDIGDNVDDYNYTPKDDVCSDDLIAAVELYDESIRLNDQFDESFRGRALALRWLAISKLTRPTKLPSDATLRELCLRADKSGDAQRAVIDRAFGSAKIASSLGYDRNAESLEARARIEIDGAYRIGANVSLEQLAEAKQTLTEALLRSESTKHRRNLNNQIENAETMSVNVLQGLAAQADVDFGAVWRTAASMKRGVDRLSDKLVSLDDKQTERMATAFRELSKSITAAHRTIDEIGKIRAFGNEVAAGPREDLRLPRDMVDLIARAGAWKLVLKRLRDSAPKVLEDEDKSCPLHAELHDSVAEWGSL